VLTSSSHSPLQKVLFGDSDAANTPYEKSLHHELPRRLIPISAGLLHSFFNCKIVVVGVFTESLVANFQKESRRCVVLSPSEIGVHLPRFAPEQHQRSRHDVMANRTASGLQSLADARQSRCLDADRVRVAQRKANTTARRGRNNRRTICGKLGSKATSRRSSASWEHNYHTTNLRTPRISASATTPRHGTDAVDRDPSRRLAQSSDSSRFASAISSGLKI
jgi:hypothetical protein